MHLKSWFIATVDFRDKDLGRVAFKTNNLPLSVKMWLF